MGRERRRAISERERRIKELKKKVQELSHRIEGDPGVLALKSEIDTYNKDIRKIKGRVDSLSVYYACFIPLFCFGTSIVLTAWGFFVFIGTVSPFLGFSAWISSILFGGWALLWLMLGVAFLSNTLIHVNRAATNPETLSALRLSFESGSTAEKFSAGQQQDVSFMLENFGKEMGEKVTAQIYFPDDFEVTAALQAPGAFPVSLNRQSSAAPMTYPNRMTASVMLENLHEDMSMMFGIKVNLPT